jgi:hypothetical protein
MLVNTPRGWEFPSALRANLNVKVEDALKVC